MEALFFFGRKSWEIDLVLLSSFLNELRVLFWSWFLFFLVRETISHAVSLFYLLYSTESRLFSFFFTSFRFSHHYLIKNNFCQFRKAGRDRHGKPQCVWKERNSRNKRDAIAMSSIGERMLHWLLEVPSSIARTISRKKKKEKKVEMWLLNRAKSISRSLPHFKTNGILHSRKTKQKRTPKIFLK